MVDEDEARSSDAESDSVPSAELTVDESGSDGNADESIIAPRRRANKKKVFVLDSDDEKSEEEFERRAFSPRTRMSITGIRPDDLSDDESEIESSFSAIAEVSDESAAADDAQNSAERNTSNSLLANSAAEEQTVDDDDEDEDSAEASGSYKGSPVEKSQYKRLIL